jgi:hypothetical protein
VSSGRHRDAHGAGYGSVPVSPRSDPAAAASSAPTAPAGPSQRHSGRPTTGACASPRPSTSARPRPGPPAGPAPSAPASPAPGGAATPPLGAPPGPLQGPSVSPSPTASPGPAPKLRECAGCGAHSECASGLCEHGRCLAEADGAASAARCKVSPEVSTPAAAPTLTPLPPQNAGECSACRQDAQCASTYCWRGKCVTKRNCSASKAKCFPKAGLARPVALPREPGGLRL